MSGTTAPHDPLPEEKKNTKPISDIVDKSTIPPVEAKAAPKTLKVVESSATPKPACLIVSEIGAGAYAKVYKAVDPGGRLYAVKKITNNTTPVSALRKEVEALTICWGHKNVIKLLWWEITSEPWDVKKPEPMGTAEFIFEHTAYGLKDVVRNVANTRHTIQYLLMGLEHVHSKNIIHCDLKPANLLVDAGGVLKIGDFGLAQNLKGAAFLETNRELQTIWYRAPELLITNHLSKAVDIWSVGCIMAELVHGVPFLCGANPVEQMTLICTKFGSPTETEWPGVTSLYGYATVPHIPAPSHIELGGWASAHATDLWRRMMTWDPTKRITAAEALKHPYFKE